jgi:hypothetical protein
MRIKFGHMPPGTCGIYMFDEDGNLLPSPPPPKEVYLSWDPPFGYTLEYFTERDGDGQYYFCQESTDFEISPLQALALLLSLLAVFMRLYATFSA